MYFISDMVKEALLVLYADDDPDDRHVFVDAVEQLNLSIKLESAFNGVDLMEKLKGSFRLPEMIFLDMNMPVKTGMECLIEIRSDSMFDKVAIIIFSTSAQSQTIDAAFDRGADLYVKKPDSFGKLRHVLSMVFNMDWGHRLLNRSRTDFLIEV